MSDVSVVVPSLNGAADGLLASLVRQTLRPGEVEVVGGVRPSGRARNLGAARTAGAILVFADDDATLGADDTLASLVAPLTDVTVGVAGTGKILPPGSPTVIIGG